VNRNSEAVINHLVGTWIHFKTALESSCKKTSKKDENPIFEFLRSNSDGT
jgi:hypothetical protein